LNNPKPTPFSVGFFCAFCFALSCNQGSFLPTFFPVSGPFNLPCFPQCRVAFTLILAALARKRVINTSFGQPLTRPGMQFGAQVFLRFKAVWSVSYRCHCFV
jgi:hypothetical protein